MVRRPAYSVISSAGVFNGDGVPCTIAVIKGEAAMNEVSELCGCVFNNMPGLGNYVERREHRMTAQLK